MAGPPGPPVADAARSVALWPGHIVFRFAPFRRRVSWLALALVPAAPAFGSTRSWHLPAWPARVAVLPPEMPGFGALPGRHRVAPWPGSGRPGPAAGLARL